MKGRPFLLLSHTISCFKMIKLSNSVRAYSDAPFLRIKEIARIHCKKLEEHLELPDEFKELLPETYNLVNTWNLREITPPTYRLYGKTISAYKATPQFMNTVRPSTFAREIRERKADDVEKSRYYHSK